MDELYNVGQFAARYGLSIRTVFNMIKQNRLFTVTVNGELRVKDPKWDAKTGTGTVEDIYILRGVEVAELLDVTPREVRYLVTGGRLSCVFVNRQRRYNLADVRKLIAARMHPPNVKKPKRSWIRDGVILWARKRLSGLEKLR